MWESNIQFKTMNSTLVKFENSNSSNGGKEFH